MVRTRDKLWSTSQYGIDHPARHALTNVQNSKRLPFSIPGATSHCCCYFYTTDVYVFFKPHFSRIRPPKSNCGCLFFSLSFQFFPFPPFFFDLPALPALSMSPVHGVSCPFFAVPVSTIGASFPPMFQSGVVASPPKTEDATSNVSTPLHWYCFCNVANGAAANTPPARDTIVTKPPAVLLWCGGTSSLAASPIRTCGANDEKPSMKNAGY